LYAKVVQVNCFHHRIYFLYSHLHFSQLLVAKFVTVELFILSNQFFYQLKKINIKHKRDIPTIIQNILIKRLIPSIAQSYAIQIMTLSNKNYTVPAIPLKCITLP